MNWNCQQFVLHFLQRGLASHLQQMGFTCQALLFENAVVLVWLFLTRKRLPMFILIESQNSCHRYSFISVHIFLRSQFFPILELSSFHCLEHRTSFACDNRNPFAVWGQRILISRLCWQSVFFFYNLTRDSTGYVWYCRVEITAWNNIVAMLRTYQWFHRDTFSSSDIALNSTNLLQRILLRIPKHINICTA